MCQSQNIGPEKLNPQERRGKIVGATEEEEDSQRTRSTESAKQGLRGLTETEAETTEPAWVCAKSSAYML